jgi:molybdopterin molybdotransferase
MTSFEQARETILQSVEPAGIERVQLLDAVGRVIAADFLAPWDLPRVDKSSMDGFAVRSADCAPGVTLKVTDYIPAGAVPHGAVADGCAARIMTGAPIPPGADAVIPLEETDAPRGAQDSLTQGGQADAVTVRYAVESGTHIRTKGSEVAAGERVIAKGAPLGPQEIGLLASFGRAMVPVYRKPRVAIISTGDELVELGTALRGNEIFNSNAFSLAAAVQLCEAKPVLVGIARDDRESHLALLSEGMQADVLITSAGVSTGDRDLVRETLATLGVEERFWKVAIRPGGGTAFGVKGKLPVFSLPGSPGASLVAFEELVRPAILKMLGHDRVIRRKARGYLQKELRKKPGVLNFLSVAVTTEDGRYLVTSAGNTEPGERPGRYVHALALLPADRTSFAAGDEVDLHILDSTIEMEE